MQISGRMLACALACMAANAASAQAASNASRTIPANAAYVHLVQFLGKRNISTETMIIDIDAYRRSGATELVRVAPDPTLETCFDDTPRPGGGSGSPGNPHPLPVVPVFPDPPSAPSGIPWSINIVIFRQPVTASDGGAWTQTTTYRRQIHRLPNGTWGPPDDWGNPQITQTPGEMVNAWCEDQNA